MTPDLDHWLPDPALRIAHAREARSDPDTLWAAARSVRVRDTGMLGRLVRWRIPGIAGQLSFQELFSSPPFLVLCEEDRTLMSGLVGRIWTLRRDYPTLSDPEDFRRWSKPGTARVLFAHWVLPVDGGARLVSEVRIDAIGVQGRLGLRAVRPLVRAFHHRVGSDGIEAAARQAETLS